MSLISIFNSFIDIIFPSQEQTRALELLDPEQFLAQAKRSLDELVLQKTHSYITDIQSIFSYRDKIVEQAIWELKYGGNRKIAKLFAVILYDYIIETLSEESLFANFSSPLLIPIPLSKERLKERGWNQTEMLAKELTKLDKNNFFTLEAGVLIKKHNTKPQTSLSKSERIKNLKNCFEIVGKNAEETQKNKEKIKNRNIILIDDVTTTGSTFIEAAKTLKLAGAREIRAFTIAH
jgi:competence protein ComFC